MSLSHQRPFPGFWHAVLLCSVFVCVQLGAMIPAGILDAFFHLRLSTNPLVLGFANVVGCAAFLLVGQAFARTPVKELFPLRRVSGKAIAGVVAACVGSIILLSEVDNLFRLILPMPDFLADIFKDLFFQGKHLWAAAFLLTIVAPVTEEFMFRGLILRGFLRRFGLFRAFLLSAVLFGAVHLNPWQFVSASLLGILFAWWYARTRSLIPSLLGHFLMNGTVVIAPRLPFEIRGFNMGEFNEGPALQPFWFDGLGVVFLAIGLWLFRCGSAPIDLAQDEDPGPEAPPITTPPSPATSASANI